MDEFWLEIVSEFRGDHTSWYFPHATIEADNLRSKLAVFDEFDGQVWSDRDVNAQLRAHGYTTGGRAGTRMFRKALENAGFCWLDDRTLRITPSGLELLNGGDPVRLLERLLWRYQLSTPINNPGNLRLFPHSVLLRVFRQTAGYITRDEFTLFVGRIANDDPADAIERIHRWRQCTANLKEEVIAACGGGFRTKVRDAGYCMNFHATASYLERFTGPNRRKGIRMVVGSEQAVAAALEAYDGAEWIHYATTADCIAAYRSADPPPDLADAVDHYLDTSQFDRAIAAYRRLPPNARSGRSIAEFERSAFLERDLEEWIYDHLDMIEPGLVPEDQGRQQPTTIGTMDIFARAANGDLVVIELKKVRASDKVFGQICRYMGWVHLKYDIGENAVRGYIVGSDIDPKLQYAARVVGEPTIRLKRFHRDAENQAIWLEEPLPAP